MTSSDLAAPRLLNVHEAAERLGVSASYLNKLRLSGEGPVYIKLGARRVVYDAADLSAWLAERRRLSTSGAALGAAA